MQATNPSRLAATITAALLAAALATACGDNDNDADAGPANTTATGDRAPTSDQAAVRQTYQAIEQAIADANPKGVCSRMTSQAQAKTATARPEATTCEQYVRLVMTNARQRIPPRLVDIEIDGNRATALVRVGDHPPYGVPFIKQNNTWKANQPLGTPQ